MFLGGIFWGLIGGDEDWTTKVFFGTHNYLWNLVVWFDKIGLE